jgi:hypothetical protein
MGISATFPDSTRLWLSNRTSATGEDYWGMALGTKYTGDIYIQSVNKNSTAVYDLLLQPNGGNVGIGTTSPIAALDINGGAENNTTPALSIRGGSYDPSDLYVLNTYNVNTGVGYAAKVIGVNIKNKVETDNTVQIRNNVGGLTSAGAIYLGTDDVNQGIFGVLGGTGTAGSTLAEYLTVKGNGNVGIGTTSPNTKLQVNGPICSKYYTYNTYNNLWTSIHTIANGENSLITWQSFSGDDGTTDNQMYGALMAQYYAGSTSVTYHPIYSSRTTIQKVGTTIQFKTTNTQRTDIRVSVLRLL